MKTTRTEILQGLIFSQKRKTIYSLALHFSATSFHFQYLPKKQKKRKCFYF